MEDNKEQTSNIKKIDYSKLCDKDVEHQEEWRIWFEEHFNAKGEYVEKKESDEIVSSVKKRKQSNIQNCYSSQNSQGFGKSF